MNEKDRYLIEKLLKSRKTVKEIAEIIGFSKQAVYVEIKKGLTVQRDQYLAERKVYLADAGQRVHDKAMENTGRPNKLKQDDEYLKQIKDWIYYKKYSPYAARVKIGNNKVCERTVYNYIYKGYIPGLTILNLPYAKPRNKKKKIEKRPFRIKGKCIEERSKDVLKRDTYGHWEMDTVYSSINDKACLLVLSERMTRQEICIKVKDRTSGSILHGLNRLEKQMGAPAFRNTFQTLTSDNGMEFMDWQGIEKSSLNKGNRTSLYFCHPYCSCERGTNENINRMIRRWIPKGDDIGLYSTAEIKEIQDWINDYPRKIFGGLSSNEYMRKLLE